MGELFLYFLSIYFLILSALIGGRSDFMTTDKQYVVVASFFFKVFFFKVEK